MEKTPVAIWKNRNNMTQMMTQVGQPTTSADMLQFTDGLSNLHVLHDEDPPTKKPFDWDWDLFI